MIKKLLIVLLVLRVAGSAFGADYCLSQSGDGSNPTGTDPSTCWDLSDFTASGGTLAAGDTVTAIYAGGTIVGQVLPPAVDGTSGNEITITIDQAGTAAVPNFRCATSGVRPINLNSRSHYVVTGIDANNKMFIDGNGEAYCVTTANGDNVKVQYVDAFDVTHALVNGVNQTNLQVLDSDLHNADMDGIYADGTSSGRIDSCYIYDINNLAIDGDNIQVVGSEALTGSTHSWEITGNIFIKDTLIKNIVYVTSTGTALYSGNVATGPGASAGYCGGIVLSTAGFTITDNTTTDSERGIFFYNSSGTGTVNNNVLEDNGTAFYVDATAAGTLNIYHNTAVGPTILTVPDIAITVNYKNNISEATTTHINDQTESIVSDYNDFYPEGDDMWISGATTDIDTLVAWRTASSQDANSSVVDPQLSGHIPQTESVRIGGTKISGITYEHPTSGCFFDQAPIGILEGGVCGGNSLTSTPIRISEFGSDYTLTSGNALIDRMIITAYSSAKTITFINGANEPVLRLECPAGESINWTNDNGINFSKGLIFDDSASDLADGDFIFIWGSWMN